MNETEDMCIGSISEETGDLLAKCYLDRTLAENCRSLKELQDLASRGNSSAAARLERLKEAREDVFWQPQCETLFEIGKFNACQSLSEIRCLASQGNTIASVCLERMKEATGDFSCYSRSPLQALVEIQPPSHPLSKSRKYRIVVYEQTS